jgi:hypothetical protein
MEEAFFEGNGFVEDDGVKEGISGRRGFEAIESFSK